MLIVINGGHQPGERAQRAEPNIARMRATCLINGRRSERVIDLMFSFHLLPPRSLDDDSIHLSLVLLLLNACPNLN